MTKSTDTYDVIVLGAGASGLICAFTAASRGQRVLVLEKANKVGKKILMSGGGRCNFTNYFIEPENFISANPHFCKSALKQFTQWDFISLVEKYDIGFEQRKHGQLFCLHSASDILNMLLKECEGTGVVIKTHCEVIDIKSLQNDFINKSPVTKKNRRYQLNLLQKNMPITVACDSLVVATGALSIPTLGGSGMGYDIARQYSIPLVERRAGLVPFMFSDSFKSICERLSGLALEVEVSCNEQVFTENMLFTHRGISGPVILQTSNYWRPGDGININLLPGLDVNRWLLQAKMDQPNILLKNLLNQKLAKSLVHELQILWWPQSDVTPLAGFSDKELKKIAEKMANWQLKPSATEGYRTAEVTLGGVDTNAISSKTMEVKNQPGLYFIGEVLDVTGHLGGYNFQWAWSSGYCAGLNV